MQPTCAVQTVSTSSIPWYSTTACLPQDVSKKNIIRIGTFESTNFVQKYSAEVYSGYAVEYLQEISKYTGWKYVYVYDTPQMLQRMLQAGEIDFIVGAQQPENTTPSFKNAYLEMGPLYCVLYTKNTNRTIFYEDFTALQGCVIGTVEDTVYPTLLAAYAKKNHFTYTLRTYKTPQQLNQALQNGLVEVAATGHLTAVENVKIVGKYGMRSFYFKAREVTPLFEELDEAVVRISQEKPYFSEELYRKYYSATVLEKDPHFTREEINFVRSSKEITVGIFPNRRPVSWIDPKTGEAHGVIVELLRYVQSVTGLQFTFVEIDLTQSAVQALKNETFMLFADLVKLQDIVDEPGLVQTDALYTAPFVAICRKGEKIDEKAPCTVAQPRACDSITKLIAYRLPNATMKFYATDQDCLNAVKNRQADFAYKNLYVANYLMSSPQYETLQMQVETLVQMDVPLTANAKTDPRLIAILNKAIHVVSAAQMQTIVAQNMAAQPYRVTYQDVLYRYKVPLVLAALLLVVSVGMFVSILIMQNRFGKRMQQQNAKLALLVQQAQYANDVKSRFLSHISHEVRTPMNAILSLSALAKSNLHKPEKLSEELNHITRSATLLLQIFNDILDMAMLESEKMQLTQKPFALQEILYNTCALYEAQCSEKNVEFSVVVCGAVEENLAGDALHLNQILLNLLSNAVKFTPPGGTVTLTVSQQQKMQQNVWLCFAVSDTGCGISAEMQSRLFLPFEQESADTAQQYGGSGLGLSITKSLVNLMGGTIEMCSQKGQGSVFTVQLPFVYRPAAGTEAEELAAMRVLLLDGWQGTARSAEPLLRQLPLSVLHCVSSAGGALEALRGAQAGQPFDAVVVTWPLHGSQGSFLQAVRAQFPTVFLVALCAQQLSAAEAAAAGDAHCCLALPVVTFSLRQALKQAMQCNTPPPVPRYQFAKGRVLVAEDNELNRCIVKELLEAVGLQTDCVADGQQAVEAFASAPPGFYFAVLLDMQMPRMDGCTAARMLRSLAHPQAATIPVYALTASATPEDIGKALGSGMNGHFAKPVDSATLYGILQRDYSRKDTQKNGHTSFETGGSAI